MKCPRAYTYDLGTKETPLGTVPEPRDVSNPLARLPLRTKISLLHINDLSLVGCLLISIYKKQCVYWNRK